MSEPLLKAWFDGYPSTQTALYVVVISGLVAVPIWQAAAPRRRVQGAVLIFVAAWLTAWGWVEESIGVAFDPLDHWKWDDEIVDLLRWVGWIPIALWLHRKLATRVHSRETSESS